MINNILKRELSKEDKTHRLFDHQKASDLCELSKILNNFSGQFSDSLQIK